MEDDPRTRLLTTLTNTVASLVRMVEALPSHHATYKQPPTAAYRVVQHNNYRYLIPTSSPYFSNPSHLINQYSSQTGPQPFHPKATSTSSKPASPHPTSNPFSGMEVDTFPSFPKYQTAKKVAPAPKKSYKEMLLRTPPITPIKEEEEDHQETPSSKSKPSRKREVSPQSQTTPSPPSTPKSSSKNSHQTPKRQRQEQSPDTSKTTKTKLKTNTKTKTKATTQTKDIDPHSSDATSYSDSSNPNNSSNNYTNSSDDDNSDKYSWHGSSDDDSD